MALCLLVDLMFSVHDIGNIVICVYEERKAVFKACVVKYLPNEMF